ncbi:TIR domain-containing protein [Candidatus Thiothrix anitrata]|uniref:Nucleotide-binding protein n=1 Tax=Candidatus Thiothrix anitrata TaxID=2823902 RepID=A0ABX7X7J3_9GAMM|nr:TIR domain-containing protein [Candidatus Thiothrix anitrata]QTR51208.1 nucleotide-binding protein [Candidatus Thiothrix anitrata]
MHMTFGQRLKQFANAIDIVELETFKQTVTLIEDYLNEVLNIQVVRIMVEGIFNETEPALFKFDLNKTVPVEILLLNQVDNCKGQMPFAYFGRKPMWIVNANKREVLSKRNAQYLDLWSGVKDIVDYRPTGVDNIRTSIIIPIKNLDHLVYGVINFETTDYLEITRLAKEELIRIAETISILYQLYKTRGAQTESTEKAVKRLADSLKAGNMPKLTKPSVFLASADKADDAVIAIIREVMAESELSDKVDCIYWKTMSSLGNINQKLLETIASCQYGICYFSQKVSDHSPQYIDNANVVFEAGMFHGRVGNSVSIPCGWIPIREQDSPPSPFDFAAERMIIVPRNKHGELNEEKLRTYFRRYMKSLIE